QGARDLRHPEDRGAPPPPLRGERQLQGRTGAGRTSLLWYVPQWQAPGDRGTGGSPLVHRRPVSSGAEIKALRSASALYLLRAGGGRAIAPHVGHGGKAMSSTSPRHVRIGSLTIGNDLPLAIIAGPCAMESREHALEMAQALQEICSSLG